MRRRQPANNPIREPAHQGDPSRDVWWLLGVSLVLAAITIAVYAPVGHFGFLKWDDQAYVTENAHVLGGLSWRSVAWAFTSNVNGNWHPVTMLSHLLDVQLFGTRPGPHHITNVALHVANTILLFVFLHRITGAMWRSACVAALFAVHPLHVESVVWVAERKDVLSTLLLMLTLWAYVAYLRPKRFTIARYLVVLGLFALALMAKPMVVTLPVVMLLLDVWPLRRVTMRDRSGWALVVVEKVPLVMLAGAATVAAIVTQQGAGAMRSLAAVPWADRLANAVVAYAAYVGAAFWPTRLSAFYSRDWMLPAWPILASAVVLAAISAVAIRVRRDHPYVLVGWLWYLVTLAPVIGFIQVGAQARADRYTYVPLIGLAIMVVWGVPEIVTRVVSWRVRRIALPAAAVAVIALSTLLARAQVWYWADDVTLWRHAVAVTDRNYMAYNLLGLAFRDRGRWDDALANYDIAERYAPPLDREFAAIVNDNAGFALMKQGRIDLALAKFQSALEAKPDLFEARNDMAAALMTLGRAADAIPHLGEALRVEPQSAEAHNGLGAALAMQGQEAQAILEYQAALRIDPKLAIAHANLAIVFIHQGKTTEAIGELLSALLLEPDHAVWQYNVAVLLAKEGRIDDAVPHLQAALRLNPDFAEARRALEDAARRKKIGGH